MPELPEVETIKKYLKRFILGKKIVGFENLDKKRIKIKEKDIINEKILDIKRKGKVLILKLSNDKEICIHLKLTGQLIYQQNKEISKSTRAIFELTENREPMRTLLLNANICKPLYTNREHMRTSKKIKEKANNHSNVHYLIFNDARKFGWIKLKTKEIEKLGIEPFSKEFNVKNLERIFKQTRRPIKVVLMDQKKIAGIGNIYANEALFLAKINPQKRANRLTKEEIKRLKNSILKVLKRAIKYEGTSSRSYIKPDQTKGRYQEKFLVYQRAGKNCLRCNSKIKKIIVGGRSTFYCKKCQK